MADSIIKIEDLNPVGEALKGTAQIPISQDKVDYRVSVGEIEQSTLSKVSDRYIDKGSKIPNENLTFGKVQEGDFNVVSGGEVFKEYSSVLTFGNIADPNNFVKGSFLKQSTSKRIINDGNKNWISIKIDLEKPALEEEIYSIDGFQDKLNNLDIPFIIMTDNKDQFLGQINGENLNNGTFAPIPETKHLYIRIANAVDIGLKPNDNEYKWKFIVRKGSFMPVFSEYNRKYIECDVIRSVYPDKYVELIPFNGEYEGKLIRKDVAYVYQRLYGNIYSKSILRYEKLLYTDETPEPSGFVGGEVVRLAGIDKVSLDVNTMEFTKIDTLMIGLESEFVCHNKGWVGGYHGNENMSSVYFILNGEIYNKDGNINFKPVKKEVKTFSYVVGSILVDGKDKEKIADRSKVNNFIYGGYNVKTRIKIKNSPEISMYSGIACVSKYFKEIFTDNAIKAVPSGDNSFIIDMNYNTKAVNYTSLDLSCRVESNVTQNKIDDMSYVRVWDRTTDTKFYRFADKITYSEGDIIECETTVNFKKIN